MVRERITITLPKECLEWLDAKVKNRTYGNRSHALEVLTLEAMKQEKAKSFDTFHIASFLEMLRRSAGAHP